MTHSDIPPLDLEIQGWVLQQVQRFLPFLEPDFSRSSGFREWFRILAFLFLAKTSSVFPKALLSPAPLGLTN